MKNNNKYCDSLKEDYKSEEFNKVESNLNEKEISKLLRDILIKDEDMIDFSFIKDLILKK